MKHVSRAGMDKQPDEVAGMFDDVAARYDRTNAILSVGNSALWRVATVRAVDPKPGERILDVACGTGASSVGLARTGASVVALDFSAGMVEQGRRRHRRIEFVEGDAERLPFGDDEFDAVTISFGLRNVEHPKVALAEMYRVLKPGGRVVICEFSKPPRAILRVGYHAYLRFLAPIVATAVSSNPDAYRYLFESIQEWPDQGTLSQWIRGVGFTRVAYRNLSAGVVALHRGRKPEDQAIRASTARRAARTRPIPTQRAPKPPQKPAG
jgi:demethylmenaquinone methyltransferase/2-methoxy-6-polyprenyl-1,4-benzoquinol methylase